MRLQTRLRLWLGGGAALALLLAVFIQYLAMVDASLTGFSRRARLLARYADDRFSGEISEAEERLELLAMIVRQAYPDEPTNLPAGNLETLEGWSYQIKGLPRVIFEQDRRSESLVTWGQSGPTPGHVAWTPVDLRSGRRPELVGTLYFETDLGEPARVTLNLDIVSLLRLLNDLPERDGYVMLVDREGYAVLLQGDTLVHVQVKPLASLEPQRIHDPLHSGWAWAVAAEIEEAGFRVSVIWPERTLLSEVRTLTEMTLVLALLGLLGLWVTIGYLAASITRPVEALSAEVTRLAGGRLDLELDTPTGGDEVSQLARDISVMANNLRHHVEEVRRVTEQQARLAGELEIARMTQQSILPTAPIDTARVRVAGFSEPAREVGGDFYDYFWVETGRQLAVVVADVSDKGIPASLYTVMTRTVLKAAVLSGRTPGPALEATNRMLCLDNHDAMFVTAWLGLLDLESATLTFACAGHPAPVFWGGELPQLRPRPPLGAMEDCAYPEQSVTLSPGAGLLVFSDGLSEAENAEHQFFGLEQMRTACEGNDPGVILKRLWEELERFRGEAEPNDDRTALVLVWQGTSGADQKAAP